MKFESPLSRAGLVAVCFAALVGAGSMVSSLAIAQSTLSFDSGVGATAQGTLDSTGHYAVVRGDSLYGIAKRFGLSVDVLKAQNRLVSNTINVGQRLLIGGGSNTALALGAGGSASTSATTTTSLVPLNASTPISVQAPSVLQHTVQRGETAYRIARQYGISLDTLVRLNNLDANYSLRVGQVLAVSEAGAVSALQPGAGNTAIELLNRPVAITLVEPPAPATASTSASVAPESLDWSTPATTAIPQPLEVAGESGDAGDDWTQSIPLTSQQTSTQDTTYQMSRRRLDESANQPRGEETLYLPSGDDRSAGDRQFVWPARGRLLLSYGPREGGLVNDGINIAVRRGEAIKSAAAGKVIYASDEMDAFGNLVLIEHADGWVTAYAHNDSLSVRKGDRVNQGQMIARAGSSGTVDRSQLHFEVRRNGKPVNPMSVLNF